jgi:hypothetical protein
VPSVLTALPSLSDQAERLIELDVHRIAGLPANQLRNVAGSAGSLLVVHQPDALARGRCFMTIGSRRRKPGGALDASTPAVWISNGTGRDGPANRNAPKVGWCWAGNRHTWLGFASASFRKSLGA